MLTPIRVKSITKPAKGGGTAAIPASLFDSIRLETSIYTERLASNCFDRFDLRRATCFDDLLLRLLRRLAPSDLLRRLAAPTCFGLLPTGNSCAKLLLFFNSTTSNRRTVSTTCRTLDSCSSFFGRFTSTTTRENAFSKALKRCSKGLNQKITHSTTVSIFSLFPYH